MGERDSLRVAYGERRYADAWAAYRGLCALGEAAAEAHLLGSLSAWHQGHTVDARRAGDAALAAGPTGALLARVRFQLGIVLRELGENAQAIELLQGVIDGAEEYPELAEVIMGPTWYNLGLAYRQARQHEGSLTAYAEAIQRFRAEGMTDYERQAWQNAAWVRCLMGDPAGAQEALDTAVPLVSGDSARWQQRLGEAFALSLGDREERIRALEICQEICGHFGDLDLDVRSHAYWVAGRITLEQGLPEEAESLARQAQEWAARARGENRCLHDAADLLRSIRLNAKPTGL